MISSPAFESRKALYLTKVEASNDETEKWPALGVQWSSASNHAVPQIAIHYIDTAQKGRQTADPFKEPGQQCHDATHNLNKEGKVQT